jgi:hypothetical protein
MECIDIASADDSGEGAEEAAALIYVEIREGGSLVRTTKGNENPYRKGL